MANRTTPIKPYQYYEYVDDGRFLLEAGVILNNREDSPEVKRLAHALGSFRQRWTTSNLGITPLIAEHSKSQEDIPSENIFLQKDFVSSRGFSYVNTCEMFFDVPYQFVLRDRKYAYANIGFESYEGGILVSQIQGVRGIGRITDLLTKLAWPKMLLSFTEDWAFDLGINEISVLPSERNMWINNREADKERLKLRYDVTARRSGYKYNPVTQVYTKSLEARSLNE